MSDPPSPLPAYWTPSYGPAYHVENMEINFLYTHELRYQACTKDHKYSQVQFAMATIPCLHILNCIYPCVLERFTDMSALIDESSLPVAMKTIRLH